MPIQSKKKFWYYLFGEYPTGTIVKPTSEFISQYKEIWVWYGNMANIRDVIKIPTTKFIAVIVKKDEYGGTYIVRWIAERTRSKRDKFPDLHWSPDMFEVI